MKSLNFNELTLDNFHQWPQIFKYFALITFAIFLCFLDYVFFLKSSIFQYKFLANEDLKLRLEFEKKYQLTNLQAYQKQLHKIEKMHEASLKKLVKESEISALLNDISQAGVSSGLFFEFFAPEIVEKKEVQKSLIIKLEVVGEYHGLALFISKISNFKQLITIENFEVTKEYELNENFLRMKIKAKIHRYYE